MAYDPNNPLGSPFQAAQGALGVAQGAQRGGVGGAGQILGGASKIASGLGSAAPNYAATLGSASNSLGEGSNALGIYGGLQQGGVGGYGGAAVNAAQLGARSGLLDKGTSTSLNRTAGDLGNVLGIYNGIKQGGVAGDAGAAINAAKLGSSLGAFGGASSAVGDIAGYAAIPLDLYNEINSWESGNTGADALAGAQTGAAIGSVIPGVGTLIGGLVGGAAGALSSAFGPGRVDPENKNFEGFTQAYNKASSPQQKADIAASVQDPYTALAGMFDLRSNQIKGSIPFYDKYGRMGEQKFTNDMTSQIQNAINNGTVSKNDDAQAIYNKVVDPWINSMGKWDDSNKPAMQALLTQMVSQYMGGQAGQSWKAIGGDSPFQNVQSPSWSGAGAATTGAAPTAPSSQSAPAIASPLQHAIGASVNKLARGGELRKVYQGDFGERRLRFDDGGGVDYLDYFTPSQSSYEYSPPDMSSLVTDPSSLQNPYGQNFDPLYGMTDDELSGGALGNLTMYNANEPIGSGGSGLSGLLSGLKNLSGGQQLALGGGLAALLASSLGGSNKSGTNANYSPSPPAPFSSSGPSATGPQATNIYTSPTTTPRTQTHPQNIDYAHYGRGPEAQFFSGENQTSGPSASPLATSTPAAQVGYVPTNMTIQPVIRQPAAGRSRGGPMYSPMIVGHAMAARGRHVHGPGDGTSDDIPAVLSDGEYVIDAGTVSMLGNGSNEAGARRLDQMREQIRRHAGRKLVKGEQFMKAKDPQNYMGRQT
jgi:hypothetical protein